MHPDMSFTYKRICNDRSTINAEKIDFKSDNSSDLHKIVHIKL